MKFIALFPANLSLKIPQNLTFFLQLLYQKSCDSIFATLFHKLKGLGTLYNYSKTTLIRKFIILDFQIFQTILCSCRFQELLVKSVVFMWLGGVCLRKRFADRFPISKGVDLVHRNFIMIPASVKCKLQIRDKMQAVDQG